MHKNRNRNALRRISKGLMKANRMRNLFAVFAIILTTFMISTIFSLGISYAENFQTMLLRTDGTTASIFLPGGTAEQKHDLEKADAVEEIGEEISIGLYTAPEANLADVSLLYKDETNFKEQYTPAISDIHGSYPEEADEIMMSEDALNTFGIDEPEEGMDVSFTFDTAEGQTAGTFRLCGWFQAYSPGSSAVALVSKEYCRQQGYGISDGMLTITADRDTRGEDLKQYTSLQEGQEFVDRYLTSENSVSDRVKIVAMFTMIALFIVLSGYLLIYNIFYISITKDIRIYGLLKTIGTSPGQLKKIVRRQGLILGAVGIPCGLLLSVLTSFIIVPRILTVFVQDAKEIADFGKVSFSPLIFLFALAFSAFTIWISCRKPARIAGRVSPVEAVKYTGLREGGKKKIRRSSSGGKLHRMAFRNIFRDKKRAGIVFLSLFMGSVTLLSVSSFFGSLDVENYADRYLSDDFSYSVSKQVFSEEQTAGFPQEFLDEVAETEGIERLSSISDVWLQVGFDEDVLAPVLRSSDPEAWEDAEGRQAILKTMETLAQNGEYGCWVYAVDDDYIEEYNKEHEEKVDPDDFREGRAVIILKYMTPAEELVGGEITLISGESGKSVSAEIAACCTASDFGYSNAMMGGAPEGFIVSSALMEQLEQSAPVTSLSIDCREGEEERLQQILTDLNERFLETGTYDFVSRTDQMAEFEDTMKTLQLFGNGISLLLLFIGVLNFINVMITGMITRKNEFAVLESIGMTRGQIRRMVTLEGLFYAVVSTGLILTAGNIVLFIMSTLVPSIADYAKFIYPAVPLLTLLILIFAVCTVVPAAIYRSISRETVTERLHTFEN